jgi:HK97 family phage prohead protease
MKIKAFYKNVEIRALPERDGKKYIVGFIPYESESEDFGERCFEKLKTGCFAESIRENNVFALHNHDLNHVLGCTDNETFILEDTETALKCTVELPPTTYADDLFEIVQRGDCRTLSFGFRCIESSVDFDGGRLIRTVEKAILDEVSFGVVFPAYGATTSEAETRAMGENTMIEDFEKKFNEVVERLDALEKLIKKDGEQREEPPEDEKEKEKELESDAFEFEAENEQREELEDDEQREELEDDEQREELEDDEQREELEDDEQREDLPEDEKEKEE